MSDKTRIEWADATVNAVNGCSVLSPGCTNCYAMKQAHRFPARQGLTVKTKGGMVWTGEVRLNEKQLLLPLGWKRPRRIFWNAHGDLFHESVPDEWIDRVFAVCALTPQHQHLILTKRSERMREYVSRRAADWLMAWGAAARAAELRPRDLRPDEQGRLLMRDHGPFPLPNVWLGVSVEDQARADQRIPDLLATPAAIRFISAEPLLGPVDLTRLYYDGMVNINGLTGDHGVTLPLKGRGPKLDWVIVGGESGPNARPMHPNWARSLRYQCAAAAVPFFFKQWGEWFPGELADDGAQMRAYPDNDHDPDAVNWTGQWKHTADCGGMLRVGKAKAGRLLDGREWSGFPA